jgi:predicted phosphoribosyltransferase
VVESLGLPPEAIEAIDARERRELERRELVYRGERPPPDVAGKTVILVDDGLATGSTMLAAVYAIRADEPARVVAAVPVADPEVCEGVRVVADEVVCLSTPQPLHAVGLWYGTSRKRPMTRCASCWRARGDHPQLPSWTTCRRSLEPAAIMIGWSSGPPARGTR